MEQSSEETAVAAQPHASRSDDDSKATDQPQGPQDDSLLETSVVVGEENELENGNSHKQPRRRLKGLHNKVQEQVCVCGDVRACACT